MNSQDKAVTTLEQLLLQLQVIQDDPTKAKDFNDFFIKANPVIPTSPPTKLNPIAQYSPHHQPNH